MIGLGEAVQRVMDGQYLLWTEDGWQWQLNPLVNDFDSPWAANCLQLLAERGYGQDADERAGFWCEECGTCVPVRAMNYACCPLCGEELDRACRIDCETGALAWLEPHTLRVEVSPEEYVAIARLKMPCDVADLEAILKDERASLILSASFHDQEVEVVPRP